MRTNQAMRSLAIAGCLAVLGLASAARAEDQTIPVDQVPKAVVNAAKATFPGASIKEASKEIKDGEPIVALTLKRNRRVMAVTFKRDGTVLLVETAVRTKDLPKVVARAVARKYPGAAIQHIDAVKQGADPKVKPDHYEVYLVTAANRPAHARVDRNGNLLKPEVTPIEVTVEQLQPRIK